MQAPILPALPSPDGDKDAWLAAAQRIAADALEQCHRKETLLSWCRLGAFVVSLAGFFALWGAVPALAGVSLAAGFLLFLLARRHHRSAAAAVDLHRLLETVLEETERRLGGHPVVIRSGTRPESEPPSGCPPLWEPAPGWALSGQEVEDFDIYAEPVGLFGILNRTSTHAGADRLARTIENPLLDPVAIAARQEAVRWLLERPGESRLLLATAAGLRDLDAELDLFIKTVREARPLPRFAAHPALRAFSFLTMAATATAIALEPGWWLTLLLLLGLVNTPILLKLRRDLLERIRPWLRLDAVTQRLASLAITAAAVLPLDGQLGRIRRAFERAGDGPALPALARRIPYLFLGLSGGLHKIVNALTLWDVHWLTRLERSYLDHRNDLLHAVEALAELEVLLSFGAFAWEQPTACIPTVRGDTDRLTIRNGYHPLIPPDEVIANDLELRLPMRVWIITGSNMSGKSTFLRMVGISALLAHAGSAVPAAEMTLMPLAILTDLRVRDDLGKHESYFLAEVRQVKRILGRSQGGEPLLGLIDEPFRGTNSEERLAAATAVIEALIRGTGFFLVATHDRQVTSLADDRVVSNHHFQETLADDVLSFDFRIRSGPATVRNAIRVLEVEGYPDGVVEAAERIVRELEQD
jgi:hypothetical protein